MVFGSHDGFFLWFQTTFSALRKEKTGVRTGTNYFFMNVLDWRDKWNEQRSRAMFHGVGSNKTLTFIRCPLSNDQHHAKITRGLFQTDALLSRDRMVACYESLYYSMYMISHSITFSNVLRAHLVGATNRCITVYTWLAIALPSQIGPTLLL